jgi:hypothetical protein
LITLILFAITVLVSLLIVTTLTRGIVSVSGTIDRSVTSPPTFTATPITEQQLKPEEQEKQPEVKKESKNFGFGMNSRFA